MQHTCLAAISALLLAACASSPAPSPSSGAAAQVAGPARSSAPAAPQQEKPRIVRSRDGTYDGEIVGVPAPGSGFSKVLIGMSADEVNAVLGRQPAKSHYYETGKRWIPFYYGNDAKRMQVLFEGEGCLIYAAGNRFNKTSPDLIRIEVDPSGACYQP